MTDNTPPTEDQARARVRTVLRARFSLDAENLTDEGEFVATLPEGIAGLTALDHLPGRGCYAAGSPNPGSACPRSPCPEGHHHAHDHDHR